MFLPSIGIGELLVRVAVVYAVVFLLLRVVGKKHVGEMAPFDILVLLLLSESVQNALIGDDKSLTGGLIAATALFGLNQLVGYTAWSSKKTERALEGTPRILVRHGHVCDDVLAKEQITRSELLEALRKKGCTSLTKVRYAMLENDGGISIGLKHEAKQSEGSG